MIESGGRRKKSRVRKWGGVKGGSEKEVVGRA